MVDFAKQYGSRENPEKIYDIVNRMQEALYSLILEGKKNPLINGLLLTGVSIGTTPTLIPHKLTRNYQGYIIIEKDSNSVIYTQGTFDRSKFLSLAGSANVTASIWVF
jgi:hypothetical protein